MINIIVDLETTANGGKKGSPEAHYKNNRVLLYGHRIVNGSIHVDDTGKQLFNDIRAALASGHGVRLIGHNLKFDLKYLIREHPHIDWDAIKYHCTMHTEYSQSGQRLKFCSLEDACENNNVNFRKGLDLGAILSSGLKMEDIPTADLRAYLKDDVLATSDVYFMQTTRAGYLPQFQQHTLPLAHMELLGLPLDINATKTLMTNSTQRIMKLEDDIFKIVDENLEWSDGVPIKQTDLNYTAPRTISYLLTREPSLGLTKRVKRNIVPKLKPMLDASAISSVWKGKKPTNLGLPMSSDILRHAAGYSKRACQLIDLLLEYRMLTKLTGTYYGPFLEATENQDTIHPKMNMCQTATSRLSSSQPNGQNMPPVARQCFKSEYGKFREIDFKQLEVVALAMLSRDKQLLADIASGEDIHFNTGRHVMGWKTPADMTDKDRTIVKNVNFGLIYGGGANGLAITTGQPVKLIKRLISEFFKRYPGVSKWQEEFYTDVANNLKTAGYMEGEQIYDSLVTEPRSNKKYYFKENKAPEFIRRKTGRKFSFKPTETKNYPVQGFAGGDIVMRALVRLHEKLSTHLNTEIRMTVHDSILVDTDMSQRKLHIIMEDVCSELERCYKLPFKLSFDIKSGIYWQ